MTSFSDLRKLLAAATPQPWRIDGIDSHIITSGDVRDTRSHFTAWNHNCTPQDAALIVAAVNALPALLAELEAARAVVKAAREYRDAIQSGWATPNHKARLCVATDKLDAALAGGGA